MPYIMSVSIGATKNCFLTCVYLLTSAIKIKYLIHTDNFSHHSYTNDAIGHDISINLQNLFAPLCYLNYQLKRSLAYTTAFKF